MNGQDPLDEFFVTNPRQSPNLSGRGGVHGEVDVILNELRIPAELDDDGDWKLTADVGTLLLMVDRDSSDVVAIQMMQPVEELVEAADEMYGLLALNYEARGVARFAALKEGGQNLLVLTARVEQERLTRKNVQGMLRDCFRLSRRVSELLGGGEPASPAPGTEPGTELGSPAPDAEPQSPAPAAQPAMPADVTLMASPQPQPPEPASPAPAAPASPQEPPAAPQHAGQPQQPQQPAQPAQPVGQPQQPAQPAQPVGQPQQPAAPAQPQQPAQPVAQPQQPPQPAQPVAQPQQPHAFPRPAPAAPQPPPQPTLPPANWYPDPHRQARLRYWDGQRWTQHVAN